MTTNHWWERAPYPTGCVNLRGLVEGSWCLWTPFGTTSVCGTASWLTKAQDQIAQSFFGAPCQDCPKALLDELDKVERHLNKGKAFDEWLGISIYEPERLEAEEVLWHLRRNALAKLKNLLSLGVLPKELCRKFVEELKRRGEASGKSPLSPSRVRDAERGGCWRAEPCV